MIRFWGSEIKKNTDECIKDIEESIFNLKMGIATDHEMM